MKKILLSLFLLITFSTFGDIYGSKFITVYLSDNTQATLDIANGCDFFYSENDKSSYCYICRNHAKNDEDVKKSIDDFVSSLDSGGHKDVIINVKDYIIYLWMKSDKRDGVYVTGATGA